MFRLELREISKTYPAVKANDGVRLQVKPGEIHAILGENGAGKSTLMKIIYGAVQPDAGTMLWNGQPVQVSSPAQARALGISMVYQHFSLFDTLTAAENVWLGLDKSVALQQVQQRILEVSQQYGLEVDPLRPVHSLSVGERQRVEIVRGLLTNPQLLILDEPTSVLTPQAVQRLFEVLRRLSAEGCSVLYISHKLDEIRELCHACTVLRGGRVTGVVDPRSQSTAGLSRLMIGAEPPALLPRQTRDGQVMLRVRSLDLKRASPFGTDLKQLHLELRGGEILGIAGVSGNGQQELMSALSGERLPCPAGSLQLLTPEGEQDMGAWGPGRRRRAGLHAVPEERLGRGAVPTMALAENTLLTRRDAMAWGGWWSPSRARRLASRLIDRFQVKAGGPQAVASSLSGGNLQKFIVGREIDAQPRVLLVSQPTWGVDVGAAALIRAELLALREAGVAVLVVSEELDELFELCDRLQVMSQGRLSPSLPMAEASLDRVGQWMSGLWDAPMTAEVH